MSLGRFELETWFFKAGFLLTLSCVRSSRRGRSWEAAGSPLARGPSRWTGASHVPGARTGQGAILGWDNHPPRGSAARSPTEGGCLEALQPQLLGGHQRERGKLIPHVGAMTDSPFQLLTAHTQCDRVTTPGTGTGSPCPFSSAGLPDSTCRLAWMSPARGDRERTCASSL